MNAAMIELVVNGGKRSVPATTTVAQLIEAMGVNAATVVAEVSGTIIAPEQFATTTMTAGAQIELVRFVGGG